LQATKVAKPLTSRARQGKSPGSTGCYTEVHLFLGG